MSIAKQALSRVDGDFYHISTILSEEDQALLHQVRTFMEAEVSPIINHYWTREEFPYEIIPGLAALSIVGLPYQGYDCPDKSSLLDGLAMMEMARVDCSIATFMAVHSGLAMGSIYLCGSEEQKRRWLPPMARLEKIGAFGLTEPEVGSGASRGLTTIARREGETWVLSGQKKWIGNATFSDVTVIWARDVEDNQVKGFLIEKGTPGFRPEKECAYHVGRLSRARSQSAPAGTHF
jgi:glutaryl-CoA dehydrogenase